MEKLKLGYGCRYLKFDKRTLTEKCVVTGEEKSGSVVCDCDYIYCEHYRTAQLPPPKKKSPQLKGQISIDELLGGAAE